MTDRRDITQSLQRWQNGEPDAIETLLPQLYDELRAIAARSLSHERPGHTLQPTALVHEAFLRLSTMEGVTLNSRAHFLAIVANVMRRVLADHARRRRAAKRGGGVVHLSLEESDAVVLDPVAADDLDTALEDLARLDSRQARAIELRFYGGLSLEETSEVLGVSLATVKRDLVVARAWLRRALSDPAA
jgi:RNA polymerase sigma factor (TIGR02999 family)